MSTPILTAGMDDHDFEELLKSSEPRRCMFDLDGHCNSDPVHGHFIQQGLLKLLQDDKAQVLSFYNLDARTWCELNVGYALNSPISPAKAATRQFLCSKHEKYFWLVENPCPDWDDPEHRARLAYRACLINRYTKEWFIQFSSKIPGLPVKTDLWMQLAHTVSLESATRKYLNHTDDDQLRHEIAYIKGRPAIAASGVILHPQIGTHLRDDYDDSVTPVRSSPIAITVLPAKRNEQVVMFSYTLSGLMEATHLLDALEYQDGSIGTARLSKKLLEEMEMIHISPKAWASLGIAKQKFIIRYWWTCFGKSESELAISSSRLNLFTTRWRRKAATSSRRT